MLCAWFLMFFDVFPWPAFYGFCMDFDAFCMGFDGFRWSSMVCAFFLSVF